MKLILKTIGFSFSIAIFLFMVIVVFNVDPKRSLLLNLKHIQSNGFYVFYGVCLALINFAFFKYLNHYVVWYRYQKYRLIIGFLSSVVITMVSFIILRLLHRVAIEGIDYEYFLKTENIKMYLLAFLCMVVISALFHVFYFYQQLQKSKIQEQKVIAGTASAKFDALKNQLDPHFLFNSLNVLTSLIDENPINAKNFTASLSKVYRYVLEQKNKDLVTLREELNFASIYMSLLKMRFEDSIVFETPEKVTNSDSKVVPLSLQLLLENAVKHNIVTTSKPLKIKIFESSGFLVVENNLQPKQILRKSSGVGLENIKQRYHLLTDRKVIINQKAELFTVAIPMLTKQISIMKTRTQNQFDDSYVRARKHVDEVKEFYYSLLSYVIVIPFLIFINYRTFWGFQWFWFPMFGWGIGLLFHAYKVYVNDGVFGRSWEQRKIEKYMENEASDDRWN